MAQIRIDLQQIVETPNPHLNRQQQVQQRKEWIAERRNIYLSAVLEQPIQHSDFARTEYGKPYLMTHPQFYFNHSHSQKHYALATSHRVADLGVDVEDLDRIVRFEALAQHAFHADEMANWSNLEEDREYWFKVWTIKEAVLKASGLGIRISLNELNTQAHATQNNGMCSHPKLGVFAYQCYVIGRVMLSVAWRTELSCHGFRLPVIAVHTHP